MEKNNDNDNKNVSKLPISKDTEVVETVEKPKKAKRKFEWTPKRKAAFEKCVAARKNQIQPKRKIVKDDSSDSSVNSSLSSSSEEYKKPRRKGLKKQFYRLKKDLIYNMKKQLKKKNVYDDDDDDDFDFPDYFPPHYSNSTSSTRPIEEPKTQTEEKAPAPTKPKYCFI